MKKLLAMLLAAAMVLSLVACNNGGKQEESSKEETSAETKEEKETEEETTEADVETEGEDEGDEEAESDEEPIDGPISPVINPMYCKEFDVMTLGNYEYGTDYTSLYEQFGADITIEDVIEDPETGLAYIDNDGQLLELGLDFLSMAMVYKTEPAGEFETSDDVYAAWWKYYITRWNYLLPEVPLYSNEYYDLYNEKIKGVQDNPTNPYWDPADALIDWASEKEDNSIILGSTTELSGQFRKSSFGKTNPGASDLDVETLISGLETISKNKEGGYEWNPTVVVEHSEEVDADGNKTFTIKIADDLVYSDGTPITAKDYVVSTVAGLTPVYTEAAGLESSGLTIVGWKDAFQKYTGPDSEEGVKFLSGIRLIDEYTFSATISADYLPYFYDITYASFSPNFPAMLLGDADIKDDGEGCYITDDFYAKDGDGYIQAKNINWIFTDITDESYAKYPYSGPYCVQSFDSTDSSAILVKNPNFKGNYEGTVPTIEKVIYKRYIDATALEDFKAGGLDVVAAITGGAQTDEALAYADANPDKAVYTHYSRAGYGKLGFRADYGPAQFQEVRQAIAYCMNRGQFAKDFTGGYGGVVDGPYYSGSWMYKAAVEQGMLLDSYATSADSAIEVLEKGGWIYNAEGGEYTEGIRYKRIPEEYINENDKNYQSVDGTYKTTYVEDMNSYFMPLVINWYGTTDNEFTDLLQTGFKENDNVKTAGMAVYNTLGDFAPMLDELYQSAIYGYYAGTPMYCAFNFATGFNSAVYDYSFNITIDPNMYDDYSAWYIKDYADIYWLTEVER